MKRLLSLIVLLGVCHIASAQEFMRIWQDGSNTKVALSDVTYAAGGASFTVNGKTYQTSQIDSITMVHIVTVTWDGAQATVEKGNVIGVDCSVQGGDVVITSTNTHNELEMVLQGASTNGSLTYTGSYKCKFYLNGLNLTSQKGAALDIQCGKRVDLILNSGTENILADAPNGLQKAALYCKGHLEIEGSGSLTVTGNAKHGICTKEYLQLKKSTGSVTVNGAVSDGIHAGQYFLMSGGTVTVSGQQGDGIQTEILTLDDDITPNPDKEFNGQIFINGGTIDVTVAGGDKKGIKSADKMTVTGGTFTIMASGAGSKGISVGKHLLINEDSGTMLMQIKATGGLYEDDVTEEETRCMGIKVVKNMAITAGTIQVANTGTKSRGIKVDGLYYKGPDATVQGNLKVEDANIVNTMPPMD
ncbi:MAG: carbohydrate-binding domain-containing protein [Bacteroidaceae bacterium]|nr:carbohydrate-binding domain-containing protein [Bacteroidaceae bacterium]